VSQKQKPDLAAALAEIGGSTRRPPAANLPTDKDTTFRQREDALSGNRDGGARTVYQQPSRLDTVPITAHFPRQVRDQLKILAIEQGSTLHNLVAEAYNDLFAKYGKPEIAPHQSMTVNK
jgi:hypothetical protein